MGLPNNSGLDLHAKFPSGKNNLLTDVSGVRVAHVSLHGKDLHTGVTAVLPHTGNLFREKVPAGAAVLNGFGKSTGLLQIAELGNIETPIVMTNTLSVGTAAAALTKYMLEQNPEIGISTSTVNPIVTECNDGVLSDVRGQHIHEEHVFAAIEKALTANASFDEGAVGGGSGTICLGFKGGIGSASRQVDCGHLTGTIGALVMSNFGDEGRLVIGGRHYGEELLPALQARREAEKTIPAQKDAGYIEGKDKGSIIMIVATDLPLSSRQLDRISRRAAIALGRVGSYMGNSSGDICIAFSTAARIPHFSREPMSIYSALHENCLDTLFPATAEAVEEAIISSLWHAKTTRGIRGNVAYALREFL